MQPQHVIVFAKRPRPGYAKTRLAAGLGAEAAAGVYARLLYTLLHDLLEADFRETSIELSLASPGDCPFFAAAFPELIVRPQISGNLGARLAHGFRRAFDEGAASVVITGSDIPGLDAALVGEALRALRTPAEDGRIPGVIGPATDGGYYLIGMRKPGADLFHDMVWSTDSVLAETVIRAEAHGVALHQLRELTDIDTLPDYQIWQRRRSSAPSPSPHRQQGSS